MICTTTGSVSVTETKTITVNPGIQVGTDTIRGTLSGAYSHTDGNIVNWSNTIGTSDLQPWTTARFEAFIYTQKNATKKVDSSYYYQHDWYPVDFHNPETCEICNSGWQTCGGVFATLESNVVGKWATSAGAGRSLPHPQDPSGDCSGLYP